MKTRMLMAILTFALVAALSGGSTTAWLTAAAPVSPNEFTAGTLLVEAANVDGSGIIEDWQPGQCREVSYDITNTGSKCIVLRARYEGMWYVSDLEFQETGSAWGEGEDFGTGLAQYFSHQLGSGSAEFALRQGADRQVMGNITVDDDGIISVKYATDAPYVLSQVHLYVGLEPPSHAQVGRLGFTYESDGCFDSFTFDLDRIYSQQMPRTGQPQDPDVYVSTLATNTTIYLAAHADVGVCEGTGDWQEWDQGDPAEVGALEVTPCDDHDSWQEGSDGYLYYVGQDDCLEGIQSGQTVTLCLNVCLDQGADSAYQDRLFRLLLTFEAIQCSNDAAYEQGWEFTCTAGSVTPTGGYFTAKAQANALFRTGLWRQQAEDLLVYTDDAELGESDHGPDTLLYGIDLENSGPRDITIDRILVGWTSGQPEGDEQGSTDVGGNWTAHESPGGADGGNTYSVSGNWTADAPEPAKILAVIVSAEDSKVLWSGHEPSGTMLNVSDYVLHSGQIAGMELVFDSGMAGSDLAIAFIMSDGSSMSVSMGPLTGSIGALCDDEVSLDEEAGSESETETEAGTGDQPEAGEQDGGTGSCDDCCGGEADPVEEDSASDESDSPGDEQQTDGEDEASGDTDGDSVSTEPEADEEDAAGNGEEDGSAGDGDDVGVEESGETEDGSTGESDADPVDDEAEASDEQVGVDDEQPNAGETEPGQEEGVTEEDEDSTSGDTEAESEEGATDDDFGDSAAEETEPGQENDTTVDADGGLTDGEPEPGDDDSAADEPDAGHEEGAEGGAGSTDGEADAGAEEASGQPEANPAGDSTGDDDADSAAEEPEAGQEEGVTEEDEDSTSGNPETNQDDN